MNTNNSFGFLNTTLRFGDVIHEARLRMHPQLSLRKFAVQLDIAAPYLSRIENNLDRPPAAKVAEQMAVILGLNKYELLHFANRIPTEFETAFCKDIRAPLFMRIAMRSGYSPEELEQIITEYRRNNERDNMSFKITYEVAREVLTDGKYCNYSCQFIGRSDTGKAHCIAPFPGRGALKWDKRKEDYLRCQACLDAEECSLQR